MNESDYGTIGSRYGAIGFGFVVVGNDFAVVGCNDAMFGSCLAVVSAVADATRRIFFTIPWVETHG